MRRGALDARGRLFAVDQISLDEGVFAFPQIRAQINVNAFVYGAGEPGSAAPAQATTPATGTTTPATAAPTTTTPAAAPPAAAAPATGGP